ncbi:MAG: NUDIX hydrolase [Saccharofermentanales bacterium]|jgi:ADP-ribose pyrophosphatase
MFTEKTIDRKTIFEGRVFKVLLDTVELVSGKLARRELVIHNGGACVVAIDEYEQVYFVRQYRKPFEQMLLEVPAGKLEQDEAPQLCATRELTEETGWIANTIIPLGKMYPTPGYCSEILHLYLALDLDKGVARPDEGEYLDIVSMPFSEALNMVDRNEIQDAKTQLALIKARRYLDSIDWKPGPIEKDHPAAREED